MEFCQYIDSLMVIFMTCLIFVRWIAPTLQSSKHFKEYVSIACDIIDISRFIQNNNLDNHFKLVKAIQAVVFLNLVQFSFSIKATKKQNFQLTGLRKLVDLFFSTEAWSTLLQLITQDIPNLIIRLFVIRIIRSDPVLVFFALKNALLVLIEIYSIVVMIRKKSRNHIF
jgi:hypothetical protein